MLILSLLVSSGGLIAQEPDLPAEGHSHIGEAFNEGPRQAAYLMDGMNPAIEFPVTTTDPRAQAFVQQGLVQLHGFWYFEAERSFRQAAAHDPDCAMAYWGMALSNVENEARAHDFAAKAHRLRDSVTEREQHYIDAVARLFGADEEEEADPGDDGDEAESDGGGDAESADDAEADVEADDDDQADEEAPPRWTPPAARSDEDKSRRRRFVRDLEDLIHAFPDDVEAKALLVNQLWLNTRAGIRIESRGANQALLDQVFARYPLHPAHHYRVHLWDQRDNADKVTDSAALIGHSAPGIAHMWHMGGHIWARLDRHADAAWQQEASARVDHAQMRRDWLLPDQIHNYAHNNEWLCRSLRHVGRVEDAIALAKNMVELPRHPKWNTADKFSASARYGPRRLLEVLETYEAWDQVLALADTMYLDPGDDPVWRARKLYLLGRVRFAQADRTALAAIVEQAEDVLADARAARAEAIDSAEEEALCAGESSRDVESAIDDAARPKTRTVRQVRDVRRSLSALLAWLDDDREEALKTLDAVGHDRPHLARLWLEHGDAEKAIEVAERACKDEGRAAPLANLVWILHQAGEAERAAERFTELRALSAHFDLDYAPFRRVAPVAAAAGLHGDWRIAAEAAADTGERPQLDELGPFRWTPVDAPDFALPGPDGTLTTLAARRGKPTLLVFFLGFGCVHCVEQLQALAPAQDRFAAEGIDLLTIGTDTVEQLTTSFGGREPEHRYEFPVLADPELDVFRRYRCYDDFEKMALHGTFLLDADGRVRWHDIGYEPFMDVDFLLGESRRLLALPVDDAPAVSAHELIEASASRDAAGDTSGAGR